ncbi:MAG: hypothetical protein ACR2H1_11845, partial [Limisphaerales bacterium]
MLTSSTTMKIILSCLFFIFSSAAFGEETNTAEFISWLLKPEHEMKGIPFSEVVKAATGKKIIPIDSNNETDRELILKIGAALDEVIKRMNAAGNSAQTATRINELSSHFEEEVKKVLNQTPGFSCDFPRTAKGKVQRSGYPDLRLEDKKSGRVIYLDPKLYAKGSRASSFRTFYYEPKIDTGKINDDAHHLIVGFDHGPRENGQWKFLNWELVDLS